MRYFQEEDWRPFRDGDRRRGRRFEALIGELLPSLLGGEWQATGDGGDGARDFVRWTGTTAWAECKIHGRNISLRTLAPTLVMALLERIPTLYFFSVSPLTRPSVAYVAQFAADTGQQIRVYDDEILERVLLAHPSVTAQYFPGKPLPPPPPRHNAMPEIVIKAFKDPEIEHGDLHADASAFAETLPLRPGEREAAPFIVDLNALFCIDIIARNPDPDAVAPLTIRHSPTPLFDVRNRAFAEGEPLRLEIPRAGTAFARLLIQARQVGTALPFPELACQIADEPPTYHRLGTAEVRFVLSPPLIGDQANAIRQMAVGHLTNRRRMALFLLYGGSGTGKTRLLSETRSQLLEQGHRVLSINGEHLENTRFDLLIRTLISRLHGLPLTPETEPRSTPPPGAPADVFRLLYDPDVEPGRRTDRCTDIVVAALERRTVTLLFDNVQAFDETTIAFLHDLSDRLTGAAGGSGVVLCFNTNLTIPGTPADSLRRSMQGKAHDTPELVKAEELNDLSEADARQLLMECLDLPQDGAAPRFSGLIDEISRRVTKRPLFLIQMMYYFHDTRAVVQIEGRLCVRDPDRLRELLQSLPARIEDLLTVRWSHVLRSSGARSDALQRTMQALSHCGRVPESVARTAGADTEAIEVLRQTGYLRRDSGSIEFFHNELFLFFRGLYGALAEPAAKAAAALQKTAGGVRLAVSMPLYLAKRVAGTQETWDRRDGLDLVIQGHLGGPFFHEFLRAYREDLGPDVAPDQPETLVQGTIALCEGIKRYISHREGLSAYDQTYTWVSRLDGALGPEAAKALATYAVEYANAYFAVLKHHLAAQPLEWALGAIPAWAFETPARRSQATANVLNRLSVARRAQGRGDESIRVAKQAVEAARASGDSVTLFRCLRDLGGNLKLRPEAWQDSIAAWAEGVEALQNKDEAFSSPELQGSLALTQCQALLASGALAAAHEEAARGLQAARGFKDHYNVIRLRFVQAVAFLMGGSHTDANTVLRGLAEAEDVAVTYAVDALHWQVPYMEGLVFDAQEKGRDAEARFSQTLDILRERVPGTLPQNPSIEIYFWDMLARHRCGLQPDPRPLPEGYGHLETATEQPPSQFSRAGRSLPYP